MNSEINRKEPGNGRGTGRKPGSKNKVQTRRLRDCLTFEEQEKFWRVLYKSAIGYEEKTDDGDVIKHKPDTKAAIVIADRLEPKLSSIEMTGDLNANISSDVNITINPKTIKSIAEGSSIDE